MTQAPVVLVLLPLVAALCALIEKALPSVRIARVSALLGIVAGVAVTMLAFPLVRSGVYPTLVVGGFNSVVGISLTLDGVGWIGSVIVLVICLSGLLYVLSEEQYDALFYFFYMMMVSGMEGAILTRDLFNLFVFLEIFGIAAYVLVAYSRAGYALLAGYKYLVMSSLAMSLFLLGVLLIYRSTGTLSLDRLAALMRGAAGANPARPSPPVPLIAFLLLIVGIGTRTAFVPYHTWLPEAHASAPHPVSAVLSGVMIKVAFIALFRVLTAAGDPHLARLFLWVGAATALFGVGAALAQIDMKRLLAFHSVSQMGYILAALGAATLFSGLSGSTASTGGAAASFLHATSHALFKSLLFLTIGLVITHAGARTVTSVHGMGSVLPLVFVAFSVGALAIAGIPPMNGFVSKKLVLYSVKSVPLVYWTLWIAGIGTVASFLKLSAVFRKAHSTPGVPDAPVATGEPGTEPRPRIGVVKSAAIMLPALLCLVMGLFPGVLYRTVSGMVGATVTAGLADVYKVDALLDTALVVALGAVLYAGVRTRTGYRVAAMLRSPRIGFNAALSLMLAGFLLFAAYLM